MARKPGQLFACLALLTQSPAQAQPAPPPPAEDPTLLSETRPNLLGSLWHARNALSAAGIVIGLTETSELFANLTSGIHQGPAYEGLALLSLIADTGTVLGWEGGTFNISALQIHGRNLSADNLHNLQTISGIEAERATRLWELWYQQSFNSGKISLRLGQQSLDQEFMVSAGSSLFANTMMGWPLLPSNNLHAGGPAYPLAALGARLAIKPSSTLTFLTAVLDDNPAGVLGTDSSQLHGAAQSGTEFNLGSGALIIAELQYVTDPFTLFAPAANARQNPGTYKLGIWFDTGTFADAFYDTTGKSLADAASSGIPRPRHGNWSVYGVADQTLWRPSPTSEQALGAFLRIMAGPNDRNPICASLNAGLTLKTPFPGRSADQLAIGYGFGQVSSPAAARLAQQGQAAHRPEPSSQAEQFVELTYQMQLRQWLNLQPDFQYIIDPNGGASLIPGQSVHPGGEAVVGLRATVTF